MAKELALDHSCDDDLFLLELFSDEMELDYQINSISDVNNSISDVNYAQGLQFQDALMASLVASPNPGNVASSVDQGGPSKLQPESLVDQEGPSKLQPESPVDQEGPSKQQPEEAEHVRKEVGESSLSFCEICVERKDNDRMFTLESCKHFFCNDCISKHVETKVMDSVHVVKCPAVDCKGVLEFDSCTSVMPKDALAKWNEGLCRSLILDWQKFYCPYKNCSAMLLRDSDELIRESECPECRRLFCAQCRVPWHSEIGCEEFQKLNEDEREREDIMLMALAKEKKWNRCPRCKFYVEKSQGCLHMSCRCGFQFCYACGGTWTSTHGGCQ